MPLARGLEACGSVCFAWLRILRCTSLPRALRERAAYSDGIRPGNIFYQALTINCKAQEFCIDFFNKVWYINTLVKRYGNATVSLLLPILQKG